MSLKRSPKGSKKPSPTSVRSSTLIGTFLRYVYTPHMWFSLHFSPSNPIGFLTTIFQFENVFQFFYYICGLKLVNALVLISQYYFQRSFGSIWEDFQVIIVHRTHSKLFSKQNISPEKIIFCFEFFFNLISK